MGDGLTGKAAKGWLHVLEDLLPCNQSALAGDIERVADFLKVFKIETAEGKVMLRETLEMAAEKEPAKILEEGLKLSPKIKDVYPVMYHYADADTLAVHATPQTDGSWLLNEHTSQRYLTPEKLTSQEASTNGLQLPKAGDYQSALTKGRFRGEIQTSEIAGDIRLPRGFRHAAGDGEWSGLKWLEPVVLDNPERGQGELVQFVQKTQVRVNFFDTKTGAQIRTIEELNSALLNL